MTPNLAKTAVHPIRENQCCNSKPCIAGDYPDGKCYADVDDRDIGGGTDDDDDDDVKGVSSSSFSLEDISRFPQELAATVDWITRCHNPFEHFQALRFGRAAAAPSHGAGGDADADCDARASKTDRDRSSHAGASYVAFRLPLHCEYCGNASTGDCAVLHIPAAGSSSCPSATATTKPRTARPRCCQRPPTYFPKQRPPFAPKGKRWNVLTEYENPGGGPRTKSTPSAGRPHGDGQATGPRSAPPDRWHLVPSLTGDGTHRRKDWDNARRGGQQQWSVGRRFGREGGGHGGRTPAVGHPSSPSSPSVGALNRQRSRHQDRQ